MEFVFLVINYFCCVWFI